MRGLTLTTLLLTLPGCSKNNPGFEIDDTTSSGGVETTAASAALTSEAVTGTLDPSTATIPTTGSDPGTSTGTSTDSDPGTSTGDPVASSSTGIDPPPQCPLTNEAFAPFLRKNGELLPVCPAPEVYLKGKLSIGEPLLLAESAECGNVTTDVYTLGTGMPLAAQAITKCLKTYLKLVDTPGGCKISLIKTYDPAVMPPPNYLVAAYSAIPDGLPLQPLATNSSYCGCPDPNNDGPTCCAELDPGELTLQPTADANVMVAQFGVETVIAGDGQQYVFHNLQSWVGPECMIGPETGRHIDWIAVAMQ